MLRLVARSATRRLRTYPPVHVVSTPRPPLFCAIRSKSSSTGDDEARKADAESSSSSTAPPPLYERFIADMGALFESIKSKVSASRQDTASNPHESNGGANPEGEKKSCCT